jgi:hypothetical protein
MEDRAQRVRALDIIDNFSSAIRVRTYQDVTTQHEQV